jgi:uncharacterized linocin/CFP29 family protein
MDASELGWPESIWGEIKDAVLKEVGKVREAQKVFPTAALDMSPTQVADERINFAAMTIKEGETKPFVVIYREFSLTNNQVMQEAEQRAGRTLARMAAKELALAEDGYILQLSDRDQRKRPRDIPVLGTPAIHADNWRKNLDFGLLGEANPPDASDAAADKVAEPILVERAAAENQAEYGENTFKAVADGIAKLVAKAQAPPYALFLPTAVYADTFVPPSPASLVTTADRIKPLVEGGFYSSPVLPEKEGLQVALAGEPVKLFIGREATAEYLRKDGDRYFFRVVERVQYVVRDPRSLILLRFAP